jgi:hypothetical protein
MPQANIAAKLFSAGAATKAIERMFSSNEH